IGNRGLLVIKDVTSLLAMDTRARGLILAALREIYDGKWERNVGVGGGRTLTWIGRLAIVGACTTAWDTAHGVIAVMGDRFVIIRADSETDQVRTRSAWQAIRNTGKEAQMRAELATAAGGLVANASTTEHQFTSAETDRLIKLANTVTWARTGVERDYRGHVADAPASEMPTRFAKQLSQLMRGAVAIGILPTAAMRLATPCARDTLPPLRRRILLDLAAHPDSRPREVARRIHRPRMTVQNELRSLRVLRVLDCNEQDIAQGGREQTVERYRLSETLDRDLLLSM